VAPNIYFKCILVRFLLSLYVDVDLKCVAMEIYQVSLFEKLCIFIDIIQVSCPKFMF